MVDVKLQEDPTGGTFVYEMHALQIKPLNCSDQLLK